MGKGKFILMLAPVGEKGFVTPFEVVEEASRVRAKGLSILHFRSVFSGGQLNYNIEAYSQAMAWLRESSDLLIEFPAWGTLKHGLEERVSPLVLKPDFIEIIPGSLNMDDHIIYNPIGYIHFVLQISSEAMVKPVFKVFSPSMIIYLRRLIEQKELTPPYIFTLFLSEDYFPPTVENLVYMYKLLPKNSKWFLSMKGRPSKALIAVALELGGNVRVGLEDSGENIGLSNERMVDEVLKIASSLDMEPATPKEASEILGKVG
ncbi:MAG: 3-keto-5-aminohexanoate cleavage protein [Synergistetes bacterium]|nr:3-keto-5-aminohexanoate cleavage protein [Synergistota bacterium]MCX8127957.1 3-keto-5-aminohexanoate cleavage protein [Synergistota bacterium]MDW8192002.1 3-keto-5-aminohexanoate cleavage protein [Synergistota bacterium]